MDWLKELLKKLGVDESKLDSAVSDIGKEIPKHFVPKQQYNDLSEAKRKAEKDVTDRDAQIAELGKTAGASDDLKKQIDQLQKDNKDAADKHAAELKELTLTNAIKSALIGKVHDETLVAGLVDRSKLVVDGEKVVGLDDQLKGLQESKSFLFLSQQDPQFRGITPFDGKPNGGTPPDTSKMSDDEFFRYSTQEKK